MDAITVNNFPGKSFQDKACRKNIWLHDVQFLQMHYRVNKYKYSWTHAARNLRGPKNVSKLYYFSNYTRFLLCSLTFVTYKYMPYFRSSHPEVFLVKGVWKICSKFTGEHTCWNVISIKLLCNFTEITLRNGCSPVNLLHIFRTPFTL